MGKLGEACQDTHHDEEDPNEADHHPDRQQCLVHLDLERVVITALMIEVVVAILVRLLGGQADVVYGLVGPVLEARHRQAPQPRTGLLLELGEGVRGVEGPVPVAVVPEGVVDSGELDGPDGVQVDPGQDQVKLLAVIHSDHPGVQVLVVRGRPEKKIKVTIQPRTW